jgi:methyl-CpG-binding domain protein 4
MTLAVFAHPSPQSAEALRPVAPPSDGAPRPPRRRVASVIDPADLRRSGRIAGAPAEHDGAAVDALGDSEEDGDEEGGGAEGRMPKRPRGDAAAERAAAARALLEHSRAWLADSRAALAQLGAGGGAGGAAPQLDEEWRAEAVRRWGDGVTAAASAAAAPGATPLSWRVFVTSRLTTPPPPSTLELLQEYYAHDSWRLLACCILMSRVSSWAVKHNTIAAFFERYPTPTAFLALEPHGDGGGALQALLHPLGLFPGRSASLVALSRRFLEAPSFDVGLSPENKIYGLGEFGVACFAIFCRGNLGAAPGDALLKAFVAWQKRRAAKAARGGDAGGSEEESGGESDGEGA